MYGSLVTRSRRLPGLDVLRHDAPRQVVVAVITPRVVEEISPGGEDVTGEPQALTTQREDRVVLYYKTVRLYFTSPTWSAAPFHTCCLLFNFDTY